MVSPVKKRYNNPRGRFVPAHLRHHPLNQSIYCRVTDYQEQSDRLRAIRKPIDKPQLELPFTAPQGNGPQDDNEE
jgi:hypothetical protein